jgi:hypothetical protein
MKKKHESKSWFDQLTDAEKEAIYQATPPWDGTSSKGSRDE